MYTFDKWATSIAIASGTVVYQKDAYPCDILSHFIKIEGSALHATTVNIIVYFKKLVHQERTD